MQLEADTKPLHAQISLQSMTYPSTGFSVPAITGTFDREKNWQNPGCYVHPVLAAMFIPKFKIFDDHILLGSIPRILKQRKNKKNNKRTKKRGKKKMRKTYKKHNKKHTKKSHKKRVHKKKGRKTKKR